MRAYRLLTLAVLLTPSAWFGCSSNGGGGAAPGTDAGPTEDGPSGLDGAPAQDGTMADAGGGVDAGHETGAAEGGGDAGPIAQKVDQTLLFADTLEGGAPHVDPNLVNAWGLAFNPTGIAWVADNGMGLATLYQPSSPTPLPRVVTIPTPAGADGGTAAPSGEIFNAGGTAGDFKGDTFIFATEDGTVAGWSSASDPFSEAGTATATLEYDNSAAGAVYKGLAIDPTTPPTLLLADFHNGRIDVLDRTYAKVTTDGGSAWSDPSVPSGYAPFNIGVLGGKVYVAYAKQDAAGHDDSAGPGNGALSVFDTTGALLKSLVKTGGALNSPWGLAMAPAGWGQLGGTLIVGSFGDGTINAYDPTSGAWVGHLVTPSDTPLKIDGLWSLVYGVSAPDAGISPTQLYFTAGPNMEQDGLFGYLTVH